MKDSVPDQPTQSPAEEPVQLSPEQDTTHAPTLAGRRRLLAGGFAAAPVLFAASTRSALATQCASPSKVFSGNMSSPGPSVCTPGKAPDAWKVFGSNPWPGNIDTPTIQTSPPGWGGAGTGAEALASFFGTSGKSQVLPLSRISLGLPDATCSKPVYDFGASFDSVFGSGAAAGYLKPAVPSFSGTGPGATCNNNMTTIVNTGRAVCLWEVLAFPTDVTNTATLGGLVDGVTYGELARCLVAAWFNKLANPSYPVTTNQLRHMWFEGRTAAGYCPTTGCSASNVWRASQIRTYLIGTWSP